MTPETFRLLDRISDSFNPLLTVVALAAPFVRRPRAFRATTIYYLSACTAIGFVYAIRAVDIRHQIWAHVGLDFSTHSAFAASLVASVGAFNSRWLGPLLILTGSYFCLQIVMRYHSALDILTSALLAVAVTLLLHFGAVRRGRPSGSG